MMLRIDEIPEGGVSLDYTTAQQGWLRGLLQSVLAEHFLPDDDAHLQLLATRYGTQVNLVGGIFVRMHATCDRCLREYLQSQQIPIHVLMVPAHGTDQSDDRALPDTDDAGGGDGECHFSPYEGDQIDLDHLIGEQVVLAQPMQSLCVPDCRGLCPRCGQDLNEGPCACQAHPIANS